MFFLIEVVNVSFDVFYWLMIARVVLSWVAPRSYNKIIEFVVDVTDFVLLPIKRVFPTNIGGVDFSPILAIFLLSFLRRLILSILYSFVF